MKKEQGNEPAFPEPYLNHPDLALSLKGGLTKREYFAAMALSGVTSLATSNNSPREIAQLSIAIADELLRQMEL